MRRIIGRRFNIRQPLVSMTAPQRPTALHITLSVEAVKKLAEQLPPPPTEKISHNVRPTLRPWAEVIDQIVREDAPLPKRVRTSAMQIFKKLREEHGYTGCYNVVQEHVRQARNPAMPAAKLPNRPKKNELETPIAASAEHGENSAISHGTLV